jgi:hypothetical protein
MDDLMYYTNGSLEIKKHLKLILKKKKEAKKIVKQYETNIENREENIKMDIQEQNNFKKNI